MSDRTLCRSRRSRLPDSGRALSGRAARVRRELARAVVLGLVSFPLLVPSARATEDTQLLERLQRIRTTDQKERVAARAQRGPYHFAIELAAARNSLPTALLWAVVRVESNFNPEAVSPVGAQGLGQLMPATAEALGVRDPFDARQNLDAAAAYLSSLIQRFKSVRLALAAYNAGPAKARAMLKDPESRTYAYVEKVLAYEREFRARESL